ncbi:MAG TPA: mandelate racemase, partial [Rhodospirillaceae bacterium]|nr:mandelate racemase [Rhodospirillaceae bacterium]
MPKSALPDTKSFPELKITKVEPFLLRAKIDSPIVTSFGTIPERAVLMVRVEDEDGSFGWGEVFGNFPAHGAENRDFLIRDYLSSIVVGAIWPDPVAAFEEMTSRTHIMALQGGEPGPFAQAIAGVDIALWDLLARKLNQPLWQLFGGNRSAVPTYGSGLNPEGFEGIVEQKLDEGYNAFKIKIGFGRERDFAALNLLRKLIGERRMMVDVNQGWDAETACQNWTDYSAFDLGWIEEPLPADRPLDEWKRIADEGGSPIAAGENLLGDLQFDSFIDAGVLGIIQPDICKWGGFSKVFPLARRVLEAGQCYCPHFLAGPIGILASAHCLAAAGGDGILEIDINPNPLRDHITGGLPSIEDGVMRLPDSPG